MADKQTITFISRAAPYGQHNPRLCLDMALACAVFEQKVNYLFLDDGVYQLLKNQNADVIDSKTLGNALETLELYGIDNVFVDADSLNARSMTTTDLLLSATPVSRTQISALLNESHAVFNL